MEKRVYQLKITLEDINEALKDEDYGCIELFD